MEQVIKQRKDIAFELLLYPAAHMDRRPEIEKILCGKDNAERLKFLLMAFEGKSFNAPDCTDKSIDKILAFGYQHKITATPTMFMPDGIRVRGAQDASRIIEMIDRVAGK